MHWKWQQGIKRRFWPGGWPWCATFRDAGAHFQRAGGVYSETHRIGVPLFIFPWGYDRLHTLQAGLFQEGIAIIAFIMAFVGQPLFRTKTASQATREYTLCNGILRT
ncbi:MAG: hypothetical protein CSA09_05530 [Candidatus Contendobacter odensis]|uniref:Uncharacterized protein n=1 Tax=Candidatus Contendibacter odensensis TaxID=1400860 RepID=A0A2G6PET4_9GAMM|nr:MAG: hypothetical protein CSA09_05530 [Candidatus Contendobacter odensis]